MNIVVVDPSRVVLRIVSSFLAPQGHLVSCFTDSRQALARIVADAEVDALITSLEVQPVSGLELCWFTRVLAQERRPIYIIAMSSNRNSRSLSEALDSGADDFISKPPVIEELNARLRAGHRLISLEKELIRQADTDPLTGQRNRRAFLDRLHKAVDGSKQADRLSFVMFDIDHFKSINDRFGHDVGDIAIQTVARLAAEEAEIVGRLGGEEFGILLPDQSQVEAYDLANRLRVRLSALRIKALRHQLHLTCSFGVSTWTEGDKAEALMKRADIALYQAKAEGRNRVVAAPHPTGTSR